MSESSTITESTPLYHPSGKEAMWFMDSDGLARPYIAPFGFKRPPHVQVSECYLSRKDMEQGVNRIGEQA